ncbi:MAG: type II toxin-antitoxin system VapC family toxin [Nitrospirales bacterium]|nr:type II toxin-antitoxin system VapC family toxin [Nitrospirales bacterium]
MEIDSISTKRAFGETLALAQKYHLSSYNASYLELAKRREIPLATLDVKLRQACLSSKVTILPA